MDCPICEVPMEEYALENTKIVYRNSEDDTKLRVDKYIFVCSKCKRLIGYVL